MSKTIGRYETIRTITLRVEDCGDIQLAADYWDCECEDNFIHEIGVNDNCDVCGCDVEDGPNSRANEVFELLLNRR